MPPEVGKQARVTITDLGSHNGVLLNGSRIAGAIILHPGDVIGVADVTIECAASESSDEETRAFPSPEPPPRKSERNKKRCYRFHEQESPR